MNVIVFKKDLIKPFKKPSKVDIKIVIIIAISIQFIIYNLYIILIFILKYYTLILKSITSYFIMTSLFNFILSQAMMLISYPICDKIIVNFTEQITIQINNLTYRFCPKLYEKYQSSIQYIPHILKILPYMFSTYLYGSLQMIPFDELICKLISKQQTLIIIPNKIFAEPNLNIIPPINKLPYGIEIGIGVALHKNVFDGLINLLKPTHLLNPYHPEVRQHSTLLSTAASKYLHMPIDQDNMIKLLQNAKECEKNNPYIYEYAHFLGGNMVEKYFNQDLNTVPLMEDYEILKETITVILCSELSVH